MTAAGVVWAIVLVVAVALATALTLRRTIAGSSMWPALALVWAPLAIAGRVATQGRPSLISSALVAVTLALPVLIAGLTARWQLRTGRSVPRAFGVAFAIGAVAAAITPLVQLSLLCVAVGDCL